MIDINWKEMLNVGKIAAVVGLVLVIIEVSRWSSDVDNALEANKTGIVELQMSNDKIYSVLNELRKEINKEFREFEKRTTKTENQITNLENHVINNSTVQALSPVQLTELGKRVSNFANAGEWSQNHYVYLDLRPGMEEYKIFDMAREYIIAMFENSVEFKEIVKSTAYEYGIETNKVLQVYQVELRDRVLKAK